MNLIKGPIAPKRCCCGPSCDCGGLISDGCDKAHEHSAWLGCDEHSDIRQWSCGCFGHKDCYKDGLRCAEHDAANYLPDPRELAAT